MGLEKQVCLLFPSTFLLLHKHIMLFIRKKHSYVNISLYFQLGAEIVEGKRFGTDHLASFPDFIKTSSRTVNPQVADIQMFLYTT